MGCVILFWKAFDVLNNIWERIFDFGPQLVYVGYVIGASEGVKNWEFAIFYNIDPL